MKEIEEEMTDVGLDHGQDPGLDQMRGIKTKQKIRFQIAPKFQVDLFYLA